MKQRLKNARQQASREDAEWSEAPAVDASRCLAAKKTHGGELRESDSLPGPGSCGYPLSSGRSDFICMYCRVHVRYNGGLVLGICEECEKKHESTQRP
jgi:hypothetical protein